ncbi:hypothetical protein C8R46DRAFT_1278085 [Mycena filopes]|nr:hypothetical protein C8R46DRAFT_1278085 [Mycena filopes]
MASTPGPFKMPRPNGIWPNRDANQIPTQFATKQDHEAASAKMWTIYVSEAEKYDKALVASWRSDMDGMLIFAGLFSATLTAFIIESYKSLSVDSGDMTLVLLNQISQQLAAAANGSEISLPASEVFVPSVASIICNGLWFTSLGLSLSCALVATLLEQWARDFLHRADMRSSPVIRARVYSYLYYGLKRFNMHTVVEVIPLLLHASLLLFFAGLVAFLLQVSNIICGLAAAILASMFFIYTSLTILPLFHLDCPYRTPLSGAFWRLRHLLRSLLKHHRRGGSVHVSPQELDTVIDAIFRSAQEDPMVRDCRALVWTMQSLADDIELEPFIRCIPDILWGPLGRRRIYDDWIRVLISHPDLQFITRINNLLRSTQSGLMSTESAMQRRITCLKAIWAICSLTEPGAAYYAVFDLALLSSILQSAGDTDRPLILSTSTLARWAALCSLQSHLDYTLHLPRMVDPHGSAALNEAILNCLKPLSNIFSDSPFTKFIAPLETPLGLPHSDILKGKDAVRVREIKNKWKNNVSEARAADPQTLAARPTAWCVRSPRRPTAWSS